MKLAVLLAVFCYAQLTSGVLHSLKYFYTSSSEVPGFPEFVAVGMVDGVTFYQYDSNSGKAVPKQDWVNDAADPQYWERNTGNCRNSHQVFKVDIETLKGRFNQTGGIHTLQLMYGCEWDDETQQKNGWGQYGYDGEDLLVYDMKTSRWIAPVHQAEATQRKWNNDQADLKYRENYLTQECAEWLQKYVTYGKASFQNKVARPVGSLLQKDSSSGVVCHATGFYPEGVMITWKKDREEMQDNVDVGETLPNEDGTFQKRAVLTVSPEERKKGKYSCEITHKSGEPIVMVFEEGDPPSSPIIIAVCVVAAVALVIGIVAFVIKKRWSSYTKASQSESDTCSGNSAEAAKL